MGPFCSFPCKTSVRTQLHTAFPGQGEADTLGQECQGRVRAFGSWKRVICVDVGSLVGGTLGYVEHLKGQFLSHTLYRQRAFHFVLSRGSVRKLLGPIPPPMSGGKEADCAGSVRHPQTSILLVQPQCKTEHHINSPRGSAYPGTLWRWWVLS